MAGGSTALLIKDRDGKEWPLRPLRFEDWGSLETRIRTSRLEAAKPYLKELRPDERIRAVGEITKQPVDQSEILDLLMTPVGLSQLLLLSLRQERPEITAEDVGKLFTTEAITEAFESQMALSGLVPAGEDTDGADPTPPPTGT